MITRREFLAGAASLSLVACNRTSARSASPVFPISLAQWSLHRAFYSKVLDPMDFARVARVDFRLDAIEYVNVFYQPNYSEFLVGELRKRADGEGVRSLLIMCDGEGRLGDPDKAKRAEAVANHHKWVDAARALGCHSIRVNAASEGSPGEQARLVADGLAALTQYGATQGINVIVENHGGLSSNAQWLADVMRAVDHPRCGTLPDFGNFSDPGGPVYDRYAGVATMLPFARAVSAKSYDFDAAGNETTIDYGRMLKIVRDSGYRGHIGIEYEGKRLSEPEGIRATRALIARIGRELSREG
jgi:L-ribulose-5-phosphate 3-epimerase